MNSKAFEFLNKYGMLPEAIDPVACAKLIYKDMEKGLAGDDADMAMIPTYLSNDGALPENIPAVIIDAGGTNFRRALVSFNGGECQVSDYEKFRMPGIGIPATWEEFISFTADKIEPLMDKTDYIGFCFSYEADITPEMDGVVVTIDKEVKVTGAKGKLIGKCLSEELAKRGYRGKRVVILNDTVAVMLGGTAKVDKSRYSSFIGQVSGTGTNTCCIVPEKRIGKINRNSSSGMIINMECGSFKGLPAGYFDDKLDKTTDCPGLKLLEKKTAGVYLGGLIGMMLKTACDENILSADVKSALDTIGVFDASFVDAWSEGKKLDLLHVSEDEGVFVADICKAMLQRSARCMSAVLLAIAEYTDTGKTKDKPLCDCAEGSLVQKCNNYRETLQALLNSFEVDCGRYIELLVVEDSTISGSAAGALLNL